MNLIVKQASERKNGFVADFMEIHSPFSYDKIYRWTQKRKQIKT